MDSSKITHNNGKIKNITIICLDDDPVFLSVMGNSVKKGMNIIPNFKFDIICTNSFSSFFKEFVTLTENNIVVDYFICDQNISSFIKGVECCHLVNDFYKIYLGNNYTKKNFTFLFFTEETNMMNYKIIKNGENLIKKENIYGKTQIHELVKNLTNDILTNYYIFKD